MELQKTFWIPPEGQDWFVQMQYHLSNAFPECDLCKVGSKYIFFLTVSSCPLPPVKSPYLGGAIKKRFVIENVRPVQTQNVQKVLQNKTPTSPQEKSLRTKALPSQMPSMSTIWERMFFWQPGMCTPPLGKKSRCPEIWLVPNPEEF